MPGLISSYPLRTIINGADYTQLVDEGLNWSNVDPGGFEAASIPVAKDCPELQVGMPIRIESGMSVAWEGRIGAIQRSLGNKTQVTGEGYGAALKENMYSMVYVDRDLQRWQQPSLQEQINLIENTPTAFQLQSFQIGADPKTQTTPALILQIGDSWTTGWQPIVEAWYDSGPENLLATVYYNFAVSSNVSAANYNSTVHLASDDVKTVNENPGDLIGTAPTSGYYTPATPYRFALLGAEFAGITGGGTAGVQHKFYYKKPAVYGNHGLTGRGSDPVGFYTSDIVRHALAQLPSASIVPGNIPDFTGYTVQQYAQYVPVPIEQVIADMAGFAGCHWGTWESLAPITGVNPTARLDFLPYPQAPTCWVLREDCDTLDINEQLAGLYNIAEVTFTDVTGVQQTINVTLDNPFLDIVGIDRTMVIDAGTNTQAGAQAFGLLVLALSQLQARAAGEVTISTLVNTPTGKQPAWMLRSGIDRLRIIDMPGASAFGLQGAPGATDFIVSRVEATVGTGGISTSVELGQGANLVEVLQSRLQVASTLADVS